jgi:hypothetical protein
MSVKITVKKRIVVNGKEYQRVEDLPPDLRAAYEKAVASRTTPPISMKVTFNGQEYDSLEAMPSFVRRLYAAAVAAETNTASSTDEVEMAPALEPSSAAPRWLIAVLVAAAALALTYWLRGRF